MTCCSICGQRCLGLIAALWVPLHLFRATAAVPPQYHSAGSMMRVKLLHGFGGPEVQPYSVLLTAGWRLLVAFPTIATTLTGTPTTEARP